MIGSTISHYRILEKLGEGGMGEVYKAQDTKLDRLVALKFLPSSTTATEADKARFIQEAKAASALNHTNVCTIYDIQEYEDPQGIKKLFIVMEFVDGETLRNKKNLSVKQVLEIGAQAAEGLAAAHEKGIVHRDIKPENIMLRKDGRVQIMDFGLAKLYAGTEASRLTKAGTTMGTVGYMSPEQVQGQDVDHRTDIFSLGVVLYELLAGESPFKGVHETAIIYEIVNVDAAPIATVKADIGPELDQLILECLEKDKDERFQSAKELARGLRKLKRGSTGSRASKMFNTGTVAMKSGVQRDTATNLSGPLVYEDVPLKKLLRNVVYNRPILWTAIVVFFLSTAVLSFLFLSKKSAGNSTGTMSIAATLEPPPGKQFTFAANGFEGVHIAVSPDGSMLAFVGQDSAGRQSLWVRQLNSLSAQELNGTDGAYYPFWSYDSKYIGYFSGGSLKKILASGGPSVTICKANDARGGSWNQNDVIVFEPEENMGIFAVAASGGKPREITKLDTAMGEQTQRWPCFLPDGQHFIFYSRVPGASTQDLDGIYAASLLVETSCISRTIR
jgi:serine/threonine protein kinase